jgi:hypothetical protein
MTCRLCVAGTKRLVSLFEIMRLMIVPSVTSVVMSVAAVAVFAR